jgi:RNA-binding protein
MNQQQQKKQYRAIGHHLNPVVTIAGNGLTEQVAAELERALDDHELIKVRINADRETRQLLINALLTSTQSELVQRIGGIALILRRATVQKPALSNLVRYQ